MGPLCGAGGTCRALVYTFGPQVVVWPQPQVPEVRRHAEPRRALRPLSVRLQGLRRAWRDQGPRRGAGRLRRGHADRCVFRLAEEPVEGDALAAWRYYRCPHTRLV